MTQFKIVGYLRFKSNLLKHHHFWKYNTTNNISTPNFYNDSQTIVSVTCKIH